MFLKIFQYSQENTCVGVFFNKVKAYNFTKMKLQYRCFLVNITNLIRILTLKKICERLLLAVWEENWISKYLQKQSSKVFCDVKKLFLEISQIHEKTPVPEPFLKKLNASGRLLPYPVGGSFPDFLCVQSFNLLVKLQVINLNKAAETICKSQKKSGRISANNYTVFFQMFAKFYATEFILFLIKETFD